MTAPNRRHATAQAPLLLLAALTLGLSACAGLAGGDRVSAEFDRETNADEALMLQAKSRIALRTIESALADYVKAENKIPAGLDDLVPKYLPAIPSLDIPACGGETNKVENYPPDVLRDGEVDGARLLDTGRWGYVHNADRVVVFIDCLKPSDKKIPWYRVRGVF